MAQISISPVAPLVDIPHDHAYTSCDCGWEAIVMWPKLWSVIDQHMEVTHPDDFQFKRGEWADDD